MLKTAECRKNKKFKSESGGFHTHTHQVPPPHGRWYKFSHVHQNGLLYCVLYVAGPSLNTSRYYYQSRIKNKMILFSKKIQMEWW